MYANDRILSAREYHFAAHGRHTATARPPAIRTQKRVAIPQNCERRRSFARMSRRRENLMCWCASGAGLCFVCDCIRTRSSHVYNCMERLGVILSGIALNRANNTELARRDGGDDHFKRSVYVCTVSAPHTSGVHNAPCGRIDSQSLITRVKQARKY